VRWYWDRRTIRQPGRGKVWSREVGVD